MDYISYGGGIMVSAHATMRLVSPLHNPVVRRPRRRFDDRPNRRRRTTRPRRREDSVQY